MKKQTGFTLIELLVVIAIIGILASVILASLNSARSKARDARRAADVDQIYTALNLYYDTYGCLPITRGSTCGPATGTYDEYNAGGWDYSSQSGFMDFLKTAGLMPQVSLDPINNITGDGGGPNLYAYRYYCYTSDAPALNGNGGIGLHLGYWKESGAYVAKNNDLSANFTDSSFLCK